MAFLKVCLKFYGINDTCTWFALKFALKCVGEMTCTWFAKLFYALTKIYGSNDMYVHSLS